MIDDRELLERELERFVPEPGMVDRVLRRRDRKRRNQRITAGVVGAAIAITIAIGGASRLLTAPVPIDQPTPTPPPERVGFHGVPPEGAEPSSPTTGELVLSLDTNVSGGDPYKTSLYVYADGRLKKEVNRSWAADGSQNTDQTIADYTYDAAGNRLTYNGLSYTYSDGSTGVDANNRIVNLRATAWNVPNAGYKRAREEFGGLDGKVVFYQVTDANVVLRPATAAACRCLYARMVAPTSGVPPPGSTLFRLFSIADCCAAPLTASATLGFEFTPHESLLLK